MHFFYVTEIVRKVLTAVNYYTLSCIKVQTQNVYIIYMYKIIISYYNKIIFNLTTKSLITYCLD